MNRFLTCTAVGLFLSLSPALAEPQLPSDDAQTPPAANQPSQIPEVMPDPPAIRSAASAQPADPAAPIPGDSSQVTPAPMAPGDTAAPPAQSSQAPLSIEPAAPKAADASGSAQFLTSRRATIGSPAI